LQKVKRFRAYSRVLYQEINACPFIFSIYVDSFVPDSDIKINGQVGHNLINLLSESEFFCFKIDKFLTNILELIINKVKNKKYSFKTIFTAYANNELKMLEIRFDFIEDYILSSIRNVANIENREEWEKRHDTGEFVKICAWCNKIFYNGKYESLDKVVYETDLFEGGGNSYIHPRNMWGMQKQGLWRISELIIIP
jgi:hypothetical protein